jgi:hypothetical protein
MLAEATPPKKKADKFVASVQVAQAGQKTPSQRCGPPIGDTDWVEIRFPDAGACEFQGDIAMWIVFWRIGRSVIYKRIRAIQKFRSALSFQPRNSKLHPIAPKVSCYQPLRKRM